MGVFSILKRCIRLCWRISLVTLLVSLPVTLFPILAGIEGAWTFHFWARAEVAKSLHAFQFEADSGSRLNYFNVPGAQSIHDFMDQKGPFHIPRVSTGNWLERLKLTQPNEHTELSAGADQLASFDGLVRDEGSFQQHADKPKRYWVYVTSGARWFRNEWDEAFDEILQQSYVKPFPSDYAMAYLDCASSAFLCGVWSVKAPSLLSFTVEKESLRERRARKAEEAASNQDEQQGWLENMLDTEYTYNSYEGNLYPVTVRVVELPLEDSEALLPRYTLPTPAIQLRSLLLDPDPDSLLENWESYELITQMMRRFNDLENDLSNKIGTWRYYLNECDKWYSRTVLQPIFGKEFTGNGGFMADVQAIVFSIGALVAEIIRFPFRMIWEIYAWFFGLGWDGQPISDEGISHASGNWMEDLFAGAMAAMMQNISAQARESAGRAAVTEV